VERQVRRSTDERSALRQAPRLAGPAIRPEQIIEMKFVLSYYLIQVVNIDLPVAFACKRWCMVQLR